MKLTKRECLTVGALRAPSYLSRASQLMRGVLRTQEHHRESWHCAETKTCPVRTSTSSVKPLSRIP